MRDYADYFIDRNQPNKCGVSVHHDIDWWMEYITGYMAKLLFLVLLALLMLVLKSFFQMGQSEQFFPIKTIHVDGKVLITQPSDIDLALATVKQQSFFSVDLNQVADALTRLPWIDSAVVTRQWPDALSVTLVERQPAYRWGDKELVDRFGHRFPNADPGLFAVLPKIVGVDGYESEVIAAYQRLVDNLGISLDRLDIEEFVLNQYLSWELHLQSGMVIKFGRDDYPKRLARFVEAFQTNKLPDLAHINVLDFRYNRRGFAVKWKPEFVPETQNGKLVKVTKKQITEI